MIAQEWIYANFLVIQMGDPVVGHFVPFAPDDWQTFGVDKGDLADGITTDVDAFCADFGVVIEAAVNAGQKPAKNDLIANGDRGFDRIFTLWQAKGILL